MSSQSAVRDKLLNLLAAGVPGSAAAAAAGVEPSYVSQLLEQEDFKLALIEQSAERLESAIQHDQSIESLEAKALRVIESKLPFVRNAAEAAKVFQILNNSKKRATVDPGAASPSSVQMVTIVLPRAAAVNLRLNNASQVIEVDGRAMAPLPSRELPALEAMKKADTVRAENLLDKAHPIHTVINGVRSVI